VSVRAPKSIQVEPWRAAIVKKRGRRDDGRWYWRARSYTDGTEVTRCRWGTRAEALGWLKTLDIEAPHDPGAALSSVGDLMETWLYHVENSGKAPRSIQRDQEGAVRIDAEIGPYAVETLLSGLADACQEGMVRRGLAGSTTNRDMRTLRTAWRWARRRGLVPDRELPLPPKVAERRVQCDYTPTRAEILATLDAAPKAGRLMWRRIAILLLYATGARPSEVAALRWADVDLERGLLTLGRHERARKTGDRVVPLHQDTLAELKAWRAATTHQGRVLNRATQTLMIVRDWLEGYQEAAGSLRWTWYGLRRAAVIAMARSGVDVATAAAITGHSPMVMLAIYRQVTDEDRRAAVLRAGLGALPAGSVLSFPTGRTGTEDRNSDT